MEWPALDNCNELALFKLPNLNIFKIYCLHTNHAFAAWIVLAQNKIPSFFGKNVMMAL